MEAKDRVIHMRSPHIVREEKSKLLLTDEEKCQLFLMDFEASILKRKKDGRLISEWKPNDWGIKLLKFTQSISKEEIESE